MDFRPYVRERLRLPVGRESEIVEELSQHLDEIYREAREAGLDHPFAFRRALAALPAPEKGAGSTPEEQLFRNRGFLAMLSDLFRNFRLAGRILAREPGFAAAVVLTLALGIGANTAIFSVVHSLLLKPLPYSQPHQLASVEVVVPQLAAEFSFLPPRIQDYGEWQRAKVAAALAAQVPTARNVTADGEPERLNGARVSANFFDVLGVPLHRGRTFGPDEEQPGNDSVVILSHELWNRRYGLDPSLLTKGIMLNGTSHRVIGITPPGVLVPNLTSRTRQQARMDFFVPLAVTESELRNAGNWNYGVLARIGSDENREVVRQQLEAMLVAAIRRDLPGANIDARIQLTPLREIYAGSIRLRLLLLLGASGMLLLVACVNIANLLMARGASRSRELATRIALGAERWRIGSQIVTESTLLAVLGGLVGVAVAYSGVGILLAVAPAELPLLDQTRLNTPVLLFSLSLSLLTGIACGLFPALLAWRKDARTTLQDAIRGGSTGRRGGLVRRALVAVQMSVATVLLAVAGLLLHSFVNVVGADRGYEVERVLAVDVALSGQRYTSAEQRVALFRTLVDNVRSIPGVLAAGAISDLPAGLETGTVTIFHADDTDMKAVVLQRPVAGVRYVTSGYFAASGSALRAGRFFGETEPAPVALISEALGARLWPGEDVSRLPGRRIRQGTVTGPPITIIGVVGDFRTGALDRLPLPQIYRSYGDAARASMTVITRTAVEPSALASALRAEVRKIFPDVPIPQVRTMGEIVAAAVAERRFQMMLTALFAGLALLLGSVGVYGVVSYSVARSTRDIGLRMALGAAREDVMRWVFSHGLRPVLIGLIVGLAAAILTARALRGLLFGIGPTDPISLGGVAIVLVITSATACYLPARRAARLDPTIALRVE